MRKFRRYILPVVIALILIVIIVKLLPDEKKMLRRDIAALKKAVEQEDRTAILQYIDPNYRDEQGLDYEHLTAIIDGLLDNGDSINIMLSGLRVKIDSVVEPKTTYASCSLGLRVIAKYENEKVLVYGGVIQPGSVKAYFRKQKDYYRVYRAKY